MKFAGMHTEIGDKEMSRNMKEENAKFFRNVCDSLDSELACRVTDCVRYISTNEEDKEWLKHVLIKHTHRFSKNAYGLLLLLADKEYLCLINTTPCIGKLPEVLGEVVVNAGLATVLGGEGFLTHKTDRTLQSEIFDKVLYDTSDDYHGHDWNDIERFFPSIYCYQISINGDVDVRENVNAFYWILAQVAIEFDMGNNPFSDISGDAWEKSVYEGSLASTQFKNLLLSYTALSWDISYLYLYQCLEDKFAYESVWTLHSKLDVNITPQQLSNMLYDELSWQPKDLDGIERIINRCSPSSKGISMLKKISGEQKLAKFIYSLRNRIVHETRETLIPLTDNERWENAIAGILYLINET